MATIDELKQLAWDRVAAFRTRSSPTAFSRIPREGVADGLEHRINSCASINQGDCSPTCGPAAFLFGLATHRPDLYVRFGIDLYEKGEANIHNLKIVAGKAVNKSIPPADMDPADWITMASIRNSQNGLLRFSDMSDIAKLNAGEGFLQKVFRSVGAANELIAGITMPREIAQWYKRAGYTDVRNCTSLARDRSWADAQEASRLCLDDYQVCMFINARMLDAKKMHRGSLAPNHWVGLVSQIALTVSDVEFNVYTWGESYRRVPGLGTLSKKDFLDNFYGYVAAKM